MSNSPTIITNPTPLIQNQPGTIIYYVDVSNNNTNTLPAPATTYTLQNSSGTTLSTFTSASSCEDITSNYQNKLKYPAANAFDSNGFFYITDVCSNFITAYNPNFNQTLNYSFISTPIGIKFNPADSVFYVCNIGSRDASYGSIASIFSLYNTSLNPTNIDFSYSNVITSNGNFTGTTSPNSTYCFYPYDVVFDNSGNIIVCNIGSTSPVSGQLAPYGFISKLFIKNGSGINIESTSIVDAAVIISYNNSVDGSGKVTTATGASVPGLQDAKLYYPSGMAYDLSNNYLYVSNVALDGSSGQITMYSIASGSIAKLNTFNTGAVGNTRAYRSYISRGKPITSLKLDNYGNLYYIYDDSVNNATYIRAIFPTPTGTPPLIFNHQLTNIVTLSSSGLNYVFGLSFYRGNIYVTGNVGTSGTTSTTTNTIEIQNAFTFNAVTLQSGDSQTLNIVNNASPDLSYNFTRSVPSSNLLISNSSPFTNQASIIRYYDNPNSTNLLVPTGGYTYNLVDSTTNAVVSDVTMTQNNEISYAPYSNELGSLNNPISIDFDGSGNLYVLNNPSSGKTVLNILTPNSGNFQIVYQTNLTINYPTAIRYNKNDNNMYISSFDIDLFGVIYKVVTTITNTTFQSQFQVVESVFYANYAGLSANPEAYGYLPIDLVFDSSYMYVSSAGNMNALAAGTYTNGWNANVTRFNVSYNGSNPVKTTLSQSSPGTSPMYLIKQDYLSNYISGIEVDASYIYVVNAPDTTKYSPTNASTTFGNCNPNISQFSKKTGQLIKRFNAGFVGKLPDLKSLNPNNYTYSVSSSLKFDGYGNLYYITYYDAKTYAQPYYLDASGNILYSTPAPSVGNYHIQAFVPSSGLELPSFSHEIVTNPTAGVLGLAIYKGDIYAAQYTKNQILKVPTSISFGNFGFGENGSQVSVFFLNTSNSYYITGGSAPIYNININAQVLNYAFATSVTITNPTPLIANSPGTLYYYDNPSTFSPKSNTTYVLLNSNGKVVSNNYTSLSGNERTIIYNNLSEPKCLTLDKQGFLYIANFGRPGDYQNGSIVKATINGDIIYVKQNVNIGKPYAIKYNSKDGYIYYANTLPNVISGVDNFYIWKMSTDGNTFIDVYLDQNYNYLYNPYELCFDSYGNIYITNGSTTTPSGVVLNGCVTKISMSYSSGNSSPTNVQIFSDYLTGLTISSSGTALVSGIAIDTITNYLYVVSGEDDASGNNINISQIPLTGNDAGFVCKKWQTGQVGNVQGQSALNFDTYGNLYYYYYNASSNTCYLNAFNPYTDSNATYSHKLLGGAVSGAYGMIYYNGNFYSSQSVFDKQSQNYIDNIVEINASYFFTGVTLSAGSNVLSINTTLPNQVVIPNIVVSASAPVYYTIPSPPIAGNPAQLIFEYDGVIIPVNGNNYVVVDSNLNYVSGILNYNSANEPNPFTFTFNNLILPGGGNYLYIFDITLGQIVQGSNMFIKIPVVCFYKGTKILCLINGKEMYVPIEKIGQGTLIKTYKRGYRKVKYNIMGKLHNTAEHSIDKLFKLSKKRFPELIEDLYVTGSHALLHDSLNEREVVLMKKVIQYAASNYESIYNAKIEDKFKLLAYHDERFEEIMMNAVFEIYHIVLENEDKNFNYGIYANGVLAESTDELTLMRMKGFEKINKTPEGLELFVNSMNKSKYPAQLQRALKR